MAGDLGDANLQMQLQTASNYPANTAHNMGECTYASEDTMWDECVSNRVDITGLSTGARYAWNQFTGGIPIDPADPTELLALQWQFECHVGGPCVIDITIDDIYFYAL
jgi:hypothetical protein